MESPCEPKLIWCLPLLTAIAVSCKADRSAADQQRAPGSSSTNPIRDGSVESPDKAKPDKHIEIDDKSDAAEGNHARADKAQSTDAATPQLADHDMHEYDGFCTSYEVSLVSETKEQNGVRKPTLHRPIDVHDCGPRESRLTYAKFSKGDTTPQFDLSGDRSFLFIRKEDDEGRLVADVYKLGESDRRGRCVIHDSFLTNTVKSRPLRDGGILYSWSAGTYVSVANLCQEDGTTMGMGGARIEISPDERYAAVVPGRGAPKTETYISVYDLQEAAEVAHAPEAAAHGYVKSIDWGEDEISFAISDHDHESEEKFVVDLKD